MRQRRASFARVKCLLVVVVAVVWLHMSSVSMASVDKREASDDNQSDENYSIVPAEYYELKLAANERHKVDLTVMYSLIFESIKFTNQPYCEFTFQNCVLDATNNKYEPIQNHYHHRISPHCFPLLKAKFCVHSANYVNTDCPYRTIHHTAKHYGKLIAKGLATCTLKFPVTVDGHYTSTSSRPSFVADALIATAALLLSLVVSFAIR